MIAIASEQAFPHGAAPLSVLVVDDEPLVLQQMARSLSRLGMDTHTADSAREARDVLARVPDIGVVVTDIRMPEEDGLSLAAHVLSAHGDESAIEIIFVTGNATLADAAAAVRSGAFDFIEKPFRVEELQDVVRRAHQRAHARRAQVLRRAELVASLKRAAHTDILTALPNQRDWQRKLAQMSGRGPLHLIRIKIRNANDVALRIGSEAADDLLLLCAERLEDLLKPGDVLARTSGYGFSWLTAAVPQAEMHAHLLRCELHLHQSSSAHGGDNAIDVAVGAAFSPSGDAAFLERAAEAALTASAASGLPELFDESDHTSFMRRTILASDLTDALRNKQIGFVYQPIVRLNDRAITGVEMLSRWHHPIYGHVPPSEFVPIADCLGLMRLLDRQVLETAVEQLGAWRGHMPADFQININVSPRTLSDGSFPQFLLELVPRELRAHLTVEITEDGMLELDAFDVLAHLRAEGVTIAIDDFGSGYSSLARIRNVPVDVIKLDRQFLDTRMGMDSDRVLLAHVIELLTRLGLTVVAEGIETQTQVDFLASAGCIYGQGYLFSYPLSLDNVVPLIRNRARHG